MIFLFLFFFPPDPDLYDSLRKYHFKNAMIEIEKIDEVKKDDWMNFVPSVGIGYNLQGNPRPTLSYSLSSILNLRKQKRERENLKTYTLDQVDVFFKVDSLRVANLLRKRETMISEIEHVRKIQELNEQLYKIQEARFEENTIFPNEYLRAKKTILEQRRTGERMKLELIELESEIFETAKYY